MAIKTTLAHERAHIYQQQIMGFANFYGEIIKNYTFWPGYSPKLYENPPYLDYWADQYMNLTP